MRRGFSGLVAGLLMFSLMGCTMFTLFPNRVLGPNDPSRPTELKRFVGDSMEPNFHDGQIVEVEEVPVTDLRHGDVILFTRAERGQYLKRLIGLPGETLEIHDRKVYLNGQVLDEPYIKGPTVGNFSPITLKADEYFVMGDNRNNSSDSRAFGPISGANILGRVVTP